MIPTEPFCRKEGNAHLNLLFGSYVSLMMNTPSSSWSYKKQNEQEICPSMGPKQRFAMLSGGDETIMAVSRQKNLLLRT